MQRRRYGKNFNYYGTSGKRGISERYGMGDTKNKFLTDRAIKLEADATKYAINHLHDSRKLNDEIWNTVQGLNDPKSVAHRFDRKSELYHRANYVPHVITNKFAATVDDVMDSTLADAHSAAQLQTRSRFTKRRKYATLMDAIHAGQKIYTQDIAELVNIYGRSVIRAQLNNRLTSYLGNMRTLNGHRMIGSKNQVPDYYVEFRHPNFKDQAGNFLYVNPNLAPDLRLYFETNQPNIANRILQNIILITKRSSLGLSLFHMMALAWSGLNAGQNPVDVFKNIMPGFKSKGLWALAGKEGYDELMRGFRNGLSIGVIEELKGDSLINALRNIASAADATVSRTTRFKPLGTMVAAPIRAVARAQEIIDTHLWDHVNTGLKATTYLTTLEKLVYRDAKRAQKTGEPLTPRDILAQRAAQFTNDAYGNQNWNQMAMNVRNHMGHRIAAALNKPSTRGYIRMLVFAPDWTLSNMRVIGKVVDVKDKAHSQYVAYTIRSALLFAFVAETLQQTAGQGSIFDDNLADALRPDLGDDKQMEISKQLAEVIRLGIYGPMHVLGHKLGTLPKSLEHTDSWKDYIGFWLKSSIPISAQTYMDQGDPGFAAAGAAGLPIYGK
jgi:hypothetical protein